MPKVTVVAFAVCALSIGTAIHAQRVGGAQPNDDRHRTLDKITTYDEMNECQMRPNVKAARALLAADNMMESEHHAARFKWKTCSLKGPHGDFMKIVPNDPRLDELRWMSAEYFLAHDPAAVAALKPLPRQRVYDRPWFKASMRHNSIDEMAACVADINPGGIAALNKAIIGSNGEQAAFASLKGDFVTCLSAGVQLKGERKAIRGALVEALYQRTQLWTVGDSEKASPEPAQ